MNKQEFASFAMAMKTYYSKEQLLPNQQAMELWFRELQDIPIDVAEAALRKWVSIQKWSPTIAEIRELASEISYGDIPDWGEGWKQVCEAMRKFGREYPKSALASMDDLTAEATKQLGTWWNLCSSTNVEADRANFRIIYESLAKKKKVSQQMALPLHEAIYKLQMPSEEQKFLMGDAHDRP